MQEMTDARTFAPYSKDLITAGRVSNDFIMLYVHLSLRINLWIIIYFNKKIIYVWFEILQHCAKITDELSVYSVAKRFNLKTKCCCGRPMFFATLFLQNKTYIYEKLPRDKAYPELNICPISLN